MTTELARQEPQALAYRHELTVEEVRRAMGKRAWYRDQRRQFQREHGYSTQAHYRTGGLRAAVLERDGRLCVHCGMTEAEHLATWGRPITIDHIDRDRSHNTMDNLQTLCLRCHGRKDLKPELRVPRLLPHRQEIEARRAGGETYQQIADALGFSIGAVWKWLQRWQEEPA